MSIFLYGVPGVGKTLLAEELSKKLECAVVELDRLKKSAQKGKSHASHPFLFYTTCTAYKAFGEMTPESAAKGLREVRKAFKAAVDAEIAYYTRDVIMEGAFFDPQSGKGKGSAYLIVARDEGRHRRQFFTHRKEDMATRDEFRAARMVQEYLLGEAKSADIAVVENNGDMADTTTAIQKATKNDII